MRAAALFFILVYQSLIPLTAQTELEKNFYWIYTLSDKLKNYQIYPIVGMNWSLIMAVRI